MLVIFTQVVASSAQPSEPDLSKSFQPLPSASRVANRLAHKVLSVAIAIDVL